MVDREENETVGLEQLSKLRGEVVVLFKDDVSDALFGEQGIASAENVNLVALDIELHDTDPLCD